MPKFARIFIQSSLGITVIALCFALLIYLDIKRQPEAEKTTSPLTSTPAATNSSLTTDSDFTVKGDIKIEGDAEFLGNIKITSPTAVRGKVLSLNNQGHLILVDDQTGETLISTTQSNLPTQKIGGMLYSDGTNWLVSSILYHDITGSAPLLGLGTTTPQAKLHIDTANSKTVGLTVQGESGQDVDLQRWQDNSGKNMVIVASDGKMVIDNSADHLLEIRPSGDTGYLSSSGGAIFIENSYNIGTGLGIYSNAGSNALGNMINIKVDNVAYAQAAFYMNYDGSSNAVEIVSNSTDLSSNALSVTGNNPNDSTVGFIGYETGRGTLKITHNGTGDDDNASALSIDLAGTGTDAQGIYVDSTATGGTDGNLLRLRNQSLDRFVVQSTGSTLIGRNGTNTTLTKYGNTSGDEFFVGTNGAFRVQRSATNSEAFRTQIDGDTQGRWLGTSDGKLKFGDGSSAQDVTLSRISAGLMHLESDLQITSRATNNDILTLLAFDGSNLAKISETSGGHGVLEIDDATGVVIATLRADGGDSYVSSGNFGIGTATFDATADKVLTFGNGTAPGASVVDGVQLWAEDVAASSELRVRDEAGNVSTVSPHNFSLIPQGPSEDMAWAFYSEKGSLAINADITKALRTVESLSGEQLIYTKDLSTGQYVSSYTSPTLSLSSIRDQLKTDMSEELLSYIPRVEIEKHMSLKEKMFTVLSEVLVKAKAVFESSVEFLANVRFNGSITVNADTGGSISIPPHTRKYKIRFSKVFEKTPLVYLSTADTTVDYRVFDITPSGFIVEILTPTANQLIFQWIALLSETNNAAQLEVIDSSEAPVSEPNITEIILERVTEEQVAPTSMPSDLPMQDAVLPESSISAELVTQ